MTDDERDRTPRVTASAPGRINLIGEHIDYSGGHVLPIALPHRTTATLTLRADDRVEAFSHAVPDAEAHASYRRGHEARQQRWVDYVQAVTSTLDREGFSVPGFELEIRSEVPVGSGLSSSAALELSILRALRTACALPLDDVALAGVAHRAETEFVGAPVGIMDQMASSLASEREALLLDTRTRQFERLPLPSAVVLGLIDSGVTHDHASGDYRIRRAESEEAAALLGVRFLCDVPVAELGRTEHLPAPLAQRARHAITEEARVLAAVAAMRAADIETLGRLFFESHTSMRDDYAVTVDAVDTLVDLAGETSGVLGARMTGGGFGGAVILLCRAGFAEEATKRVLERYSARGHAGRILLPAQLEGA